MQGVKGPNRDWKRLQRPGQCRLAQFYEDHQSQERSRVLGARRGQPITINTVPDLVFQQTAGNQGLLPQLRRPRPGLEHQLRERDEAVDVDQERSSLSRAKSSMSGSNVGPGNGIGRSGMPPGSPAGISHPSRMPRPMTDSGFGLGGTISATARPRSVTTTLSPGIIYLPIGQVYNSPLAGRGETDIFAELVLQDFETDSAHGAK
jgi:hypothetical protein